MKNPILIACILIALSSCTSYQYVKLDSNLEQTTNSKHYYHQDENVYLDFDFSGPNLPMSIFVENIGRDTLYFDLSRTFYLVNDVIVRNAIPDKEGRIKVHQDYHGQLTGVRELESNENILIIPMGDKLKMYFDGFLFPYNKQFRNKSQSTRVLAEGKIHYINKLMLSDYETPDFEIDFFFATDPKFLNGYDVVCVFSPDAVYTDMRKPQNFPVKEPNVFYTSHKSQAGGAVATTLVLGIGILGILANYEEDGD